MDAAAVAALSGDQLFEELRRYGKQVTRAAANMPALRKVLEKDLIKRIAAAEASGDVPLPAGQEAKDYRKKGSGEAISQYVAVTYARSSTGPLPFPPGQAIEGDGACPGSDFPCPGVYHISAATRLESDMSDKDRKDKTPEQIARLLEGATRSDISQQRLALLKRFKKAPQLRFSSHGKESDAHAWFQDFGMSAIAEADPGTRTEASKVCMPNVLRDH